MTGFTDTNLVVLGAVGALTFSLLSSKTVQYFVGVGFFAIAFLLTYSVIKDLNTGMFTGLLLGVFATNFFKWVKNDTFSAIFLIIIAIVGVLLLISLLLNLRFFNVKINFPTYKIKGLPKPSATFQQINQH